MKRTATYIATAALGAIALTTTPAPADDAVEQLMHSLVQVEYTLKYDSGQSPRTPGWAERCPSCGRYHIQPGEEYVDEERPMEVGGYLISPTHVVTGDFFLQNRFIRDIDVRLGDEVVSATPMAHATEHYAMILELDEPFEQGRPLTFTDDAQPPYRTAHWQQTDAQWTLELKPLTLDAMIMSRDGKDRFSPMAARGLVIDSDASPVGLGMNQAIPSDDSWKGSPEQWTWIDREKIEQLFDEVDSAAEHTLPRVELQFRPGRSTSRDSYSYYYGEEDDTSVTERHAIGVLVDDDTMLVLASLEPRTTARLEEITIHFPDGDAVEATFAGSLEDYGAMVVTLDQPREKHIAMDRDDITRHRQNLLIGSEIELHGRNRISRTGHTRIAAFRTGWQRNVYPDLPGDTENLFLFNTDHTLVALPVLRRKPSTDEDRYYSRDMPTLTAASQIAAVVDDLDAHVDPQNVPLTEEEQLRLAWLGVEMQALDEELARMYNVSEITNDGYSGGMVSFVYENSPAEEAGLQSGDLLLRIHTESRPRPIDIQAEEDLFAMWGGFPWDEYDDMPEDYFDQMPPPWPTADSTVNRALTEVGFGETVEIELHRDDESRMIELEIVEGPPHHDAASRHEDEPLGLTLSNLTYEVRRYFQKASDDPGLVISKIEMGSRASVAGLKPYEIITHINDEPLHSVDDFERLLESNTDLRLNVERMHRTRTVRLSRPESAQEEAAEDDDQPAEAIDLEPASATSTQE